MPQSVPVLKLRNMVIKFRDFLYLKQKLALQFIFSQNITSKNMEFFSDDHTISVVKIR
jgi:hypothetical protein